MSASDMKQDTFVQDIDRIFSISNLIISFSAIFLYLQFVAKSPPHHLMLSFLRAPYFVFHYGGAVVFYWYIYLCVVIFFLLTLFSLFIPKLTKIRAICEVMTIFFLLVVAYVIVGTVTLTKDPFLYLVFGVFILYIVLLGIRTKATTLVFKRANLLQIINIGRKEAGISRKIILSAGLLGFLTILVIYFLQTNLAPDMNEHNAINILWLVLLTPFWEEFFFRVYFLNRVNDSSDNYYVSVILSSVCFSFGHMDFLATFPHAIDFILFLKRLLGGGLLGVLYISPKLNAHGNTQKQIWLPILLHGLLNFYYVLFGN